jgi:N-acyl-D-aspartate/D-glutamate deacylase
LSATLQPFSGHPTYQAIAHLPLATQVEKMRDPSFRARLLAEQPVSIADDGSSLPRFWDDFFVNLEAHSARMYAISTTPDSEPPPESSVLNRARAAGRSPLEMLYDIVTEDDQGRSLLYFPFYNFTPGNLSAVREMMLHPLSFIGAGDAGAHVGLICDNAYPTFALAFWTRDRTAGPKIKLERMVHAMTGAVADHFAFVDRGRIAAGAIADVNVIDFDHLRLGPLHVARDLPAGGRRLMQDSTGYLATLVAGVPIAEKDQLTGNYPGKLLRATGAT